MKAFLIYSFSDNKKFEELKKTYFEPHKSNLQILSLQHHKKFFIIKNFLWKILAKRKIRKANFVLFLVSKTACQSENIKWELNYAVDKQKDIYTIKLNSQNEIPNNISYKKTLNLNHLNDELIEILNTNDNKISSYLFNNIDDINNTYFEEYKLMVQTSEALVERRQKMNTFFITANGALLSLLGILFSKMSNQFNSKIVVTLLLISIGGIVLCYSWNKLITSYGQLNRGKFEVINRIENKLPLSIFSAEWKALDEGKNKKTYNSFTNAEKKVPFIFGIIYVFLIMTDIICIDQLNTIIYIFNCLKKIIA